MLIIGPPTATYERMLAFAINRGAHRRFIDEMLPIVWSVAETHEINPVGMVCQAGLETGWGHFSGNVKPEFHNTCGLKVSAEQQAMFPGVTDGDNPLAHAMFSNWRVGAVAHAQHLWAYVGRSVKGLVIDPRYHLVSGPAASRWRDLGGRWSPNPTYGAEVEELMAGVRSGGA
jgi:hypothetical protein